MSELRCFCPPIATTTTNPPSGGTKTNPRRFENFLIPSKKALLTKNKQKSFQVDLKKKVETCVEIFFLESPDFWWGGDFVRFCHLRGKNLFLKHRRSFSFLWPRWWTFCNFDDDRLVEELVMNDSTLYNCGKFYWICPNFTPTLSLQRRKSSLIFLLLVQPQKSFSRFSFFQTRLEFKSKQKVREEENRTPLSCCVR